MTNSSSSYRHNNSAWQRFAVSADMQEIVARAAGSAMDYAVSISPTKTGDYKSSFRLSTGRVRINGWQHAQGVVSNDSRHAVAVEFGSSRRPRPSRVIARAAEHIGRQP